MNLEFLHRTLPRHPDVSSPTTPLSNPNEDVEPRTTPIYLQIRLGSAIRTPSPRLLTFFFPLRLELKVKA